MIICTYPVASIPGAFMIICTYPVASYPGAFMTICTYSVANIPGLTKPEDSINCKNFCRKKKKQSWK